VSLGRQTLLCPLRIRCRACIRPLHRHISRNAFFRDVLPGLFFKHTFFISWPRDTVSFSPKNLSPYFPVFPIYSFSGTVVGPESQFFLCMVLHPETYAGAFRINLPSCPPHRMQDLLNRLLQINPTSWTFSEMRLPFLRWSSRSGLRERNLMENSRRCPLLSESFPTISKDTTLPLDGLSSVTSLFLSNISNRSPIFPLPPRSILPPRGRHRRGSLPPQLLSPPPPPPPPFPLVAEFADGHSEGLLITLSRAGRLL